MITVLACAYWICATVAVTFAPVVGFAHPLLALVVRHRQRKELAKKARDQEPIQLTKKKVRLAAGKKVRPSVSCDLLWINL
jgi:hypothetical protein